MVCEEHNKQGIYCYECMQSLLNHEKAKTDSLARLLDEWLKTPFFETKEDWEKWVIPFRKEVELAMKNYKKEITYG